MMMTETAVGGLGFTKYLESCVSKIGETATFECNIHSDGDAPEVAWSVSLTSASRRALQSVSFYCNTRCGP